MNLYSFVRFLFQLAVRLFYRRVTVKGREKLEEDRPLIVIANHPNGLLDIVLVGVQYRRQFWFMAKDTLVRSGPLRWAMAPLHIIPVFRKQDGADPTKNIEMFKAAGAVLKNGEGVLGYPEGASLGRRKLIPLKTGIARLAFAAESSNGFELGLRIQPIGISYSDFGAFYSSATVEIGDPIDVTEWKELHAQNPRLAVRQLTVAMESALKMLTVEVAPEHSQLFEDLGKLSEEEEPDDQIRLRKVATEIGRLSNVDPDRLPLLAERTERYVKETEALGLAPGGERQRSMLASIGLMLCMPLALAGWLGHYLPFALTKLLIAWLPPDRVFTATRKLTIGFGFCLAWYALAATLGLIALGFLGACGVILALAACGAVAHALLHPARRLFLIWTGRACTVRALEWERKQLLVMLRADAPARPADERQAVNT